MNDQDLILKNKQNKILYQDLKKIEHRKEDPIYIFFEFKEKKISELIIPDSKLSINEILIEKSKKYGIKQQTFLELVEKHKVNLSDFDVNIQDDNEINNLSKINSEKNITKENITSRLSTFKINSFLNHTSSNLGKNFFASDFLIKNTKKSSLRNYIPKINNKVDISNLEVGQNNNKKISNDIIKIEKSRIKNNNDLPLKIEKNRKIINIIKKAKYEDDFQVYQKSYIKTDLSNCDDRNILSLKFNLNNSDKNDSKISNKEQNLDKEIKININEKIYFNRDNKLSEKSQNISSKSTNINDFIKTNLKGTGRFSIQENNLRLNKFNNEKFEYKKLEFFSEEEKNDLLFLKNLNYKNLEKISNKFLYENIISNKYNQNSKSTFKNISEKIYDNCKKTFDNDKIILQKKNNSRPKKFRNHSCRSLKNKYPLKNYKIKRMISMDNKKNLKFSFKPKINSNSVIINLRSTYGKFLDIKNEEISLIDLINTNSLFGNKTKNNECNFNNNDKVSEMKFVKYKNLFRSPDEITFISNRLFNYSNIYNYKKMKREEEYYNNLCSFTPTIINNDFKSKKINPSIINFFYRLQDWVDTRNTKYEKNYDNANYDLKTGKKLFNPQINKTNTYRRVLYFNKFFFLIIFFYFYFVKIILNLKGISFK